MLNHQLYNLNNLLLNKQIQKQKGGDDVIIENDSPIEYMVKNIMKSQPSYGIKLKGLFETFKKIKPITPDLEESLEKYIGDLIKNEHNMIGIQTLLSLILKDPKFKNDTFDTTGLYKIATEYGKKKNKNDKLVNSTLQFLKSRIIPLYNDSMYENKMLLVIPGP
jgi:hypothetical protein